VVNKRLTKKFLPKPVKHQVTPIGTMGGVPLILPNSSDVQAKLDKGQIVAPTQTVAHADTTGQTTDDHHDQDHAASHTTGGDIIKLQDFTWDAGLTYTGTNPAIIWGGGDNGDDFELRANSAQTYPFIRLNGNGNIAHEVATGDSHNFKVNNAAVGTMNASGFLNKVGDFTFDAGDDCRFILSDAAGVRAFRILDSDLNGVFVCDSDGNINLFNDLNSTGDITATGLSAGLGTVTGATLDIDHAATHTSVGSDSVDHNTLTNYVANQHIDWTNATSDLATTGDIESTSGAVTGVNVFAGTIGDIRSVAWQDYGSTSTVTGWALLPLPPVKAIWYKKIGKLVYVSFLITGTSNGMVATFTLPFTSSNSTNYSPTFAVQFVDNSVQSTISGMGNLPSNSATVSIFTNWANAGWTPFNTKTVTGQFVYEAA
tara:strand:- start:1798 stop:3081 length:1284 start_codon:yes stop_codon:yes gene_type:complete